MATIFQSGPLQVIKTLPAQVQTRVTEYPSVLTMGNVLRTNSYPPNSLPEVLLTGSKGHAADGLGKVAADCRRLFNIVVSSVIVPTIAKNPRTHPKR